jgi:NADH-dependent butanol dehydrogenase A
LYLVTISNKLARNKQILIAAFSGYKFMIFNAKYTDKYFAILQNFGAFERFAREIFGVNSADEGIAAFKTWLSKIGAPVSLKAVGIEGETLDEG